MRHNKKTPGGAREREALVAPSFGEHFVQPQAVRKRYPRSQVALDDVLDAYALAITARRLHGGSAMKVPESKPERDANGLSMEIWY